MKNVFKGIALAAVMFVSTQFANAQQKIGHINFGEIISSTNEFKAAQEQLKALNDAKTKELQDMFALFQKKQNEGNDKVRNRSEANKDVVDAELQTIGNELRDMEKRMQDQEELSQQELGKKQQELFEPIQKKVVDAINVVSKEKGYAYVLDISTGNIPYYGGGDDLTADIKTKLGVK